MNSGNQKNFLESMENTIVLEARLIDLKRRKQAFDREIKDDMARIVAMINEEKNNWGGGGVDANLNPKKIFLPQTKWIWRILKNNR